MVSGGGEFMRLTVFLLLAGIGVAAFAGAETENGKRIVRADETWKPIDMSALSVRPGSALDLSGIHEPGPAGKYGRAGRRLPFRETPGQAGPLLRVQRVCKPPDDLEGVDASGRDSGGDPEEYPRVRREGAAPGVQHGPFSGRGSAADVRKGRARPGAVQRTSTIFSICCTA